MSRPAMSLHVTGGCKRPAAVVNARLEAEDSLRGETMLSATPPSRLSVPQRAIYRWLYRALNDAGVLSVLDREALSNAAICFDRLQKIDAEIEAGGTEALLDRNLCSVRDTYFKQCQRITVDLCLSPSARAKLGAAIASMNREKKDPLLEALES